MAAQKNDMFTFTREEFYAAKRVLSPSELGVWCYLADGYKYNKDKIAQLNGITVRSVERAFKGLQEKGYYMDGHFVMAPAKISVSQEMPTVDMSQYKWLNKF